MQKKEIKGLNEYLYYEKAKNGLEIYLWQNPNSHNTYASINVKYGSSYYRYKCNNKVVENKTGIAHFLEHVSFNLSKKSDASAAFNKLGTFNNAYTDNKNTCYYIVYQDNEQKNLETLLQIAFNPYISEENVEKEKGIIIEEKRRSLNNPYYNLYYKAMENLYHFNNYRATTLGTLEDIKSITNKDLIDVHNAFYNPKNMKLVVCGNIDPKKTIETILKILKKYPERKYQKKKIYFPKEPLTVLKKSDIIYGNVKIPKVKISYKLDRKAFKIKDNKRLGYIINIIMKCNFGITSEFREKLELDDKVNSFSASSMVDNDNVILSFNIENDNYQRIFNKIKRQLKHLVVTKSDYIAKTHSIKAAMIADFENNEVVADIINSCLTDNDNFDYNILNKYMTVKYKDVIDVISNIGSSNYSMVVLMPK